MQPLARLFPRVLRTPPNRVTGYVGVSLINRSNKFEVRFKGKYIGVFQTKVEAAVAYARAAAGEEDAAAERDAAAEEGEEEEEAPMAATRERRTTHKKNYRVMASAQQGQEQEEEQQERAGRVTQVCSPAATACPA